MEQPQAATKVILGTLAHELRNPIWRIANAAAMLRRISADKQLGALADVIDRQVFFMESIVNDLLEDTRMAQGLARLHHEPLDLRSLVEEAVETCQPGLWGQAQRVELEIPEGLRFQGDRMKLRQVLVNLIANASRFSPRGAAIHVVASIDEDGVSLRVQDQGKGIPAELLPHVFDPFVQEHGANGFSRAGLGLGLAVVRSIVEMHGGRVDARSGGPGCGSQIQVVLPRMIPAQASAARAAPAPIIAKTKVKRDSRRTPAP